MSAFRQRKADFKYFGSASSPVIYLKKENKVQGDVTILQEQVIVSSVSDYNLTHPVPTEEFTVGQQLEAGVSMKEIPVNGMLDSNDNLDYEEDKLQEKVLEKLQKEEN